ncbi:MAG: hypothetical protein ACPGJR_04680 [Akkermansiaceae bacterium]
MNRRFFLPAVLPILLLLPSCSTSTSTRETYSPERVRSFILAQRKSGHPNYNPKWVYVVDPGAQRMKVISLQTGKTREALRCGTGRKGLGFAHAKTPPGIFAMGGVRIAENADSSIQTGDTKRGVSGIYAEILYPPTYPTASLRGTVPNGVVIHSYNPEASEMLRQRRAQRMIGRIPCTTGCPVPDIDEAHKLVPYLKQSAGKFDPASKPNFRLQKLIQSGKVRVYSRPQLGDPVYILNRSR